MAKITISRLFEISKYLATPTGKELQGALQYLSELAENTVRILRNGITFSDNIDCLLKTISFSSGAQVNINPPDTKRIIGIIPLKISGSSYYIIDRFGWVYNASGEIIVYCTNVNSAGVAPASTQTHSLDLVMLFG